MSLLINLRHLERKDVELRGELTAAELDLEGVDELIRMAQPLEYDLVAEAMGNDILVQGRWELRLNCECARCLKSYALTLKEERWACHLPLQGEEAVSVNNDCVDLTPYLREDILLGLPQRPLCSPDCKGLSQTAAAKAAKTARTGPAKASSTAWAELNKLKF
ncbi:MAG TPA: YceD family protein [Dongiaceae bacterium]|jgi:uncharacterized protein|nr:YceD family protein [Dongiaceae bacterium]